MNAPVCGTGDDLGPVVGERKAYGDIRQVDTAGSLATHDECYLLALVAVSEGAGFVAGRREARAGE